MRIALCFVPLTLALLACSSSDGGACVTVREGWTTPERGQPVHFVASTVSPRDRTILWNGVAVTEQALTGYLRQTARTEPLAFIIFDSQTTDCAFAARVRDLIDRNYPCHAGACGQGTQRAFETAPYVNVQGAPPA